MEVSTARVPTTTGSGSTRDIVTTRQWDRVVNPPGIDSTNRDRRVKSTFELNIEKTNRSDFKPPQRSVGGDGSSRFKQTLNLFQSKEAEAGGHVGPVKALPPSLATQRSVGRITRPSAEEFKPSHSVVEMRRGSAAERRYPPSTETSSSSYKTDANRLRGVSRSVQGLDTYRTEFDVRNPATKSGGLQSRDWNEGYGSRDFGKAKVSGPNSVETSSSRAHSSDEEREKKTPQNLSGKDHADVDKPLEARQARGSLQFGLDADKQETEPRKRYDANGTSESAGVGVTSFYSRKETRDSDPIGKQKDAELPQGSISPVARYSSLHDIGVHDKPTSAAGRNYSTSTTTTSDWDKKPGSDIRRDDDNQRTTVTSKDEIRIRSETSKWNEPKDLYAYKHRSPHVEESVTGNRDTAKQTTKYEESTKRYDDKYPDTKTSHFDSHKVDPAVRYDTKKSYDRDEYKKTDAAPHRMSYQEPEKSASGSQSYQPQKGVNQQSSSISDIFSKRSAVIRGRVVGGETDPHFVPSVTPKVVEATPTGYTASRSPAEREMTRRLEAAVDDTIKEFHHDADRTTRTKDPSPIAGDVIEAKIKLDHDEPARRTDYDVTSATRTSREPYGSDRRHYGLERTSEPVSNRIKTELEEPLSHRKITLSETKQEEKSGHKQPAFEVNFSVSDVDKPNRFGEDKTDKGNVERVAVGKDKQEQKGDHHQPAFELNFSVSESEKHRRSGESKMDRDEGIGVGKDKHKENIELLRINESVVIQTPKEEKRLSEGLTRDQKTPYGDQKNAAEDRKTSYQPHDSFHRPEVNPGSVVWHGIDAETKSVKTTPIIGDLESSKSHRNEFEIEIDTRGLLPDRSSSEKRVPAVSLSNDPKALHCGLQQELIVEFPDSKFKESTKREVKDTTDDFYFGMTGGTSEEIFHPKKTGRQAEIVVEIPRPEERQRSRVDLLPSPEHKLSPEEHEMPPGEQRLSSHDHKLPSYEHKLPTEEHKLFSQDPKTEPKREPKTEPPKTEPKTPSKERELPSLEHRLSPLSSQESKSRPEEHKMREHDHKPPSYEPKLPTEVHKSSPLEPKTSFKEHKLPSEEDTFLSLDHKLPSHEQKLPKEEHKSPPKDPKTPSSVEHKLPKEEDKLPSLEHRLSPLGSPEHKSSSEEHKVPSEQHKLPSQDRRPKEEKPSLPNRDHTETGLSIDLDSHPAAAVQRTASDKVVIRELDTLSDGTRFDMNSNIPMDTKQTPPPPPPRPTMILKDDLEHPSTSDPSHDRATPKTTVGIVL